MNRRRAAILPMVLFTVLLIGLMGAVFAFRVHSDLAATTVLTDRLQTRLAAEAGVDWVKLFLRTGRSAKSAWYDNPDAFHRMLLWAEGEDSTVTATSEEFEGDAAYRFSIVADDPTDDEHYIRFGLTDEASKLNINIATEDQLKKLVTLATGDREDIDPQVIVDAIIDWRDTDTKPRGEAGDTEGIYYRGLPKPYKVKNAPFDTVEELLLVKGVTPDLLFGEDFDRNGLLTENEDDGDLSFPLDNQDEVLNRGMYPYLTVFSYESNVAADNRQRVYLFGKEETVRSELTLLFPASPDVVDFVVKATRKNAGGKNPDDKGPDGKNPDGVNPDGEGPGGQNPPGEGQPPTDGAQDGAGPPPGDPGPRGPRQPRRPGQPTSMTPGGRPPSPNPNFPPSGPGPKPKPPSSQNKRSEVPAPAPIDGKRVVLAQLRDVPPSADPQGDPTKGDTAGQNPQGAGGQNPPGQQPGGPPQQGQQPGGQNPGGQNPGGQNPPGQEGTGDGGPGTSPIRSPADLMFPRKIGDDLVPSPLTSDDLAILMDRTTTKKPEERKTEGLINVNTAPRPVLECLEGLTSEHIDSILAMRDRMDDEMTATPAWLLSEGVLEPEAFAEVAPFLTARAQQFTIESLGYADHQGMVTRLQVVVDMLGPIAQTIYVRDISYLGATYPIREDDLEQQRAH